jgi:hypothetical protein
LLVVLDTLSGIARMMHPGRLADLIAKLDDRWVVTDGISCRGLLDFPGCELVPGNSSHISWNAVNPSSF